MIFFIVSLFLSILSILLTILLNVLAYKNRANDKYVKYSAISAIVTGLFSLLSLFSLVIPKPIIKPLDNGSKTYIDDTEVTIDSDYGNLFKIYYSTDGSDPKDNENNIYEKSITISKSTTICARNKFLWYWSDITIEDYKFENLSFNGDIKDSVIPNEKNSETEKQIKDDEPTETESQPKETEQHDTQPDNTETGTQTDSVDTPSQDSSIDSSDSPSPQPSETTVPNEGINPSEGSALMAHINQYRTQSGISELTWDSGLEQEAQNIATAFATGGMPVGDMTYIVVGRQCNGAKNAQRAVSDWITGNDYIPSEADSLLNSGYTQMGGALYYLPNGNEYGYHYFWIVCLR